jgi:hypothetical protein
METWSGKQLPDPLPPEHFDSHSFRYSWHQVMSKASPALRSEVDGMWYFETHPEVAEYFKQAGVFTYYKKLTTFHQQVAEAFSLSYDGRIVKIGREEFIMDEAVIAEYIGLSRMGDCWF